LRYFNPIGAHPSGLLGEDPNGIPNNLLPVVMKAAKGELTLNVFGNDYDTPDGTGVRDYIHVCDLAAGHTAALKNAFAPGVYIYNLGTGNGFSVLEIINTFERVNGVKVPYVITARRPGDIAACYADSSKAERELGFKAVHGIEDMCRDAWNYAKDR
jgi:UDP-glucose 4-epimerase